MRSPRDDKGRAIFAVAVCVYYQQAGLLEDLNSFLVERKGKGRSFMQLLADYRKKHPLVEWAFEATLEEVRKEQDRDRD